MAERFNSRYGDTFVVPEHVVPDAGARVMDLQEPTNKMSKSAAAAGTIGLLEDLSVIEKKIKRAVTDNDAEVRYDPDTKPGVSNLLSILAAATDRDPVTIADDYVQYGPLKADTAAAVAELLRPIQARYAELAADPVETRRLLEKGAAKEHVASGTFELGGELPVNTDGGLKTFGHPTGATGVRMIYENTLQLRGQAGERQVKNATTALSHNIGGPPTTCGIAILGMP